MALHVAYYARRLLVSLHVVLIVCPWERWMPRLNKIFPLKADIAPSTLQETQRNRTLEVCEAKIWLGTMRRCKLRPYHLLHLRHPIITPTLTNTFFQVENYLEASSCSMDAPSFTTSNMFTEESWTKRLRNEELTWQPYHCCWRRETERNLSAIL